MIAHATRVTEIGQVCQHSGERWYDLRHGFLLRVVGQDNLILPEESFFDVE